MPWLREPTRECPVCGTNLYDGDGRGLRPCPFGPHAEDEYPESAA